MFKHILTYYNQAKEEKLKDHPLANIVRNQFTELLLQKSGLDQNKYGIKGSVGQGGWAEIPWISIYIQHITQKATFGYYICYLFCADGRGVYLSLHQGWQYFEDKYGRKEGRVKIKKTSLILREKLNTVSERMNLDHIDLKGVTSRSKDYEAAHICGCFYDFKNFPSDKELLRDLFDLLQTYNELDNIIGRRTIEDFNQYILMNEEGCFLEDEQNEDVYQISTEKAIIADEEVTYVDKKVMRPEPVRDRSGRVRWGRKASISANAIKKSKYTCEFDLSHTTFISKKTKKPYVESHHLIPIARQNDFEFDLDQTANITSLCPTCHRKIHLGVDEEKEILIKELYAARKSRLEKIGISITLDELIRMYRIEE
ncbi:DUF3578 domain-containing protein [Hazenella sp. IB182353]|nr:DUF3578 domain-containing protein [Polycladospora coralii]